MSVDAKSGEPQEWKKYSEYFINTDPDQDDKATQIKIFSLKRPHMRAFHAAWWGFFMAFFIWFAITPLLTEIKKTLHLTKKQVWTSNIVGSAGTIGMRFILGPICDKFGPRLPFMLVLCLASIPTACIGFIQTSTGLSVIRFFIGIAGGSFVMCQYWTSRMFTRDIVGTSNAIVGGWGNLGGGVTQLVMGSALFPLFQLFFNGNSEKAWRTVFVVPAFVTFCTGILLYKYTDDAPKGNYKDMKKHGTMPEISAAASFRSGAVNLNSWLLFFQYACSFGVELTMDNAAALYFKDQFGLSTQSAAAIASIFGWMNLFTRATGGFLSDKANARMGLRGRLAIQTVFLICEGIMVLVFAQTTTLGLAIFVMVIFSLFVQGGCGTTYGIVPYVDPASTGSVSGIVGAGGNCGAVGFGLAFRQLSYKKAFTVMGFTILGSSLLSIFVNIKGHARLFWGEDTVVQGKTLTVPEPGTEQLDDRDEQLDNRDEEVHC